MYQIIPKNKKNNKNRKQKKISTSQAYKGTVCNKCEYERKLSDKNPKWQCPCCQSAYSKVNICIEERKRKISKVNAKYLEKRNKKKEMVGKKPVVGLASWVGIITIAQGIGNSCARAFSNPWLVALGTLVLVGALALGWSFYSE